MPVSTDFTRLLEALSEPRRAHSLRVAELAKKIAEKNGLDPEKAYLAGLLHDVAKELPEAELLHLAPPENPVEEAHPLVLHGRAARVLAERAGVRDPEVLAAIEGHVVGVAPDFPLGIAVYLADLADPGRGYNQDLLERALKGELLSAYEEGVRRKVAYLEARGIPVHPFTREVLRRLAG